MEKISCTGNMYQVFRCTTAQFDWEMGRLLLAYAFDDALSFTEMYEFSLPAKVTDAQKMQVECLARQLHIAAGVSYYKAFCPPEIMVESSALSSEDQAFWESFYVHGLGEFYYQNNLSVKGNVHVASLPCPEGKEFGHPVFEKQEQKALHPLVPIGGGKDSSVTAELLREAGIDFSVFVMGKNEKILASAKVTKAPVVQVSRALDAEFLRMVNAEKVAYNGHVPITGILSFVALIAAVLNENDAVMMSNEASASFGNVVVDGIEVNHQWSKSLEFERALQNHLVRHGASADMYFSALRQYSELAIVKKFAKLTQYHEVATSCNANFAITKQAEKRWCAQCPKCAFVFATLGAFLSEKALVKMFGANMFADPVLVPLFSALLGNEIKPFECVGEPDEVRAAMYMLHRDGKFLETPTMHMFARDVLPTILDGEALCEKVVNPRKEHAIPEAYMNRISHITL